MRFHFYRLRENNALAMEFERGHLYHIYNQGNNRQQVFFDEENYLYFIKKIRTNILPFADILGWCLMPNHFHLMVHVNVLEIDKELICGEASRGATKYPSVSRSAILNRAPTNTQMISFNASIGIMLASYTRAINKQKDWSGSLFRSKTKSICLTKVEEISPVWITNMGITQLNSVNSDFQYPNICFNYILQNPLKSNLVENISDWEFSAYNEIYEKSKSCLISIERVHEYGLCLT